MIKVHRHEYFMVFFWRSVYFILSVMHIVLHTCLLKWSLTAVILISLIEYSLRSIVVCL